MPTSNKEHKDQMIEWYKELNPKVVLDIGIGEGTYSDLMKHLNQSLWIGVEAWAPYVREYDLGSKYNCVIISDILHMSFNTLPTRLPIPLIIIGDCLEHFEKETAINLIKRLQMYSKNIFISIPHGDCPQGSVDGNWFEKHRSTWDHEELKNILSSNGKVLKDVKGQILSVYWWQA